MFWCLVIYGGVTWMVIGWGFPETGRNVVGNGSVKVKGWWSRPWWRLVKDDYGDKRKKEGEGLPEETTEATQSTDDTIAEKKKKGRSIMSNPFACLGIICWRDTALVMWMQASFYSIWYCIQTSIPSIYHDIYATVSTRSKSAFHFLLEEWV